MLSLAHNITSNRFHECLIYHIRTFFSPRLSCLIWIMESQTIMFTEIFVTENWKWTKIRSRVRGMCPLCSQWQYCVLDYFWPFEWQCISQGAVWSHQSGFLVLSFHCLLTTALKKIIIIKGKKKKQASCINLIFSQAVDQVDTDKKQSTWSRGDVWGYVLTQILQFSNGWLVDGNQTSAGRTSFRLEDSQSEPFSSHYLLLVRSL